MHAMNMISIIMPCVKDIKIIIYVILTVVVPTVYGEGHNTITAAKVVIPPHDLYIRKHQSLMNIINS